MHRMIGLHRAGKWRPAVSTRRANVLATLLVTSAVFCIPAFAAEKAAPLPKDLPAYGPLKPVAAPAVKQSRLPNGLEVWLVPEPGFPKTSFVLAVRSGYSADPKDRPGMADLLTAVVTQGTKTRSARQVAEDIQATGGDLSANATADAIILSTSVLSSKSTAALALLADIAQNATFADTEVGIAKSNAASALEANEAEPGFLGNRALRRALFGDHPYAIVSPTQDSIAKTTAADLKREYAEVFRPDQALLVIAGDFDEKGAVQAIGNSFGSWKAPATAPLAPAPPPNANVTTAVVYVPRAHSVQTGLSLGAFGPRRADTDYATAQVANAIYGGMFGSRLVSNIREDKGYTYSPGARVSAFRSAGMLRTRAEVRNEVTGASFNEISYELNRMATTAPEPQEIESAKRYLIGSAALHLQSRDALAGSLAELWINGLPPSELDAYSHRIENVSADQVQAVSRKYFPARRMTVVAVGDEQVIKDQLAPFGLEFQRAQ